MGPNRLGQRDETRVRSNLERWLADRVRALNTAMPLLLSSEVNLASARFLVLLSLKSNSIYLSLRNPSPSGLEPLCL